jgi:hypothetical protein
VVVLPSATVAVAGVTETLTTGTIFTVNVADACRPSTETTTVPVPAASAVTSPPELTLVMPGVLVDQVTVRPDSDSGCPLAPRAITLSWRGWPTDIVAVDGLTATLATGSAATVIVAVPDAPSLVAVIVTVPAETPVTTPAVDTVATWVLLLAYVTGLPVRT